MGFVGSSPCISLCLLPPGAAQGRCGLNASGAQPFPSSQSLLPLGLSLLCLHHCQLSSPVPVLLSAPLFVHHFLSLYPGPEPVTWSWPLPSPRLPDATKCWPRPANSFCTPSLFISLSRYFPLFHVGFLEPRTSPMTSKLASIFIRS